jgi:hypothetical protein
MRSNTGWMTKLGLLLLLLLLVAVMVVLLVHAGGTAVGCGCTIIAVTLHYFNRLCGSSYIAVELNQNNPEKEIEGC